MKRAELRRGDRFWYECIGRSGTLTHPPLLVRDEDYDEGSASGDVYRARRDEEVRFVVFAEPRPVDEDDADVPLAERAARLCDAMAAARAAGLTLGASAYDWGDEEASKLATRAHHHATASAPNGVYIVIACWAEAAAMLRCGWMADHLRTGWTP